MSNVLNLLRKDAVIEWRQKASLASMLIYVVSTVFVVYFSFSGDMPGRVWVGIYWIILLFAVVNLTLNTFLGESGPQFYYVRSLVRPSDLIFAKLIYNAMYFAGLSLVTLAALRIFLGMEVSQTGRFLAVVALGSAGLAGMFTLLSAITARLGNVALIAILGFPIVIPVLLLSIKLSLTSMDPLLSEGFFGDLGILALLNLLIAALAVVLFTYLWRD